MEESKRIPPEYRFNSDEEQNNRSKDVREGDTDTTPPDVFNEADKEEMVHEISAEYTNLPKKIIESVIDKTVKQTKETIGILGFVRKEVLKTVAIIMSGLAISVAGYGGCKKIRESLKEAEKFADGYNSIRENIENVLAKPTRELTKLEAQIIIDEDIKLNLSDWYMDQVEEQQLPIPSDELREKLATKADDIYKEWYVWIEGKSVGQTERKDGRLGTVVLGLRTGNYKEDSRNFLR